jgi:hypothetical protein
MRCLIMGMLAILTVSGFSGEVSAKTHPPLDFDHNFRSGILWRNVDGQPAVWLTTTSGGIAPRPTGLAPLPNPGLSWKIVGTGDFNDDGYADILWQNENGQPAIWYMGGTTEFAGGPIINGTGQVNPGESWTVSGVGDFSGNGYADILWQNANGQLAIWYVSDMIAFGAGLITNGSGQTINPGPAWKAVGVGDFNGDGKADILLRNVDGQPAIWLMDGTREISGNLLPNPGTSWKMVGIGDFNGDGLSDILWQNESGQPVIWLTTASGGITPGPTMPNPGTGWQAVAVGDYNGDGLSDILWQNDNGQPVIWLMTASGGITPAPTLPNPGSSWQVMPDTYGCTDPSAINYDVAASVNNRQCTRTCTVANGTGTKSLGASGYGVCTATACNSGFDLFGGACYAKLAVGNYQVSGEIFYSNGESGYCYYNSWNDYLLSGNPPDESNVTSLPSLPAGVQNATPCQTLQPQAQAATNSICPQCLSFQVSENFRIDVV